MKDLWPSTEQSLSWTVKLTVTKYSIAVKNQSETKGVEKLVRMRPILLMVKHSRQYAVRFAQQKLVSLMKMMFIISSMLFLVNLDSWHTGSIVYSLTHMNFAVQFYLDGCESVNSTDRDFVTFDMKAFWLGHVPFHVQHPVFSITLVFAYKVYHIPIACLQWLIEINHFSHYRIYVPRFEHESYLLSFARKHYGTPR